MAGEAGKAANRYTEALLLARRLGYANNAQGQARILAALKGTVTRLGAELSAGRYANDPLGRQRAQQLKDDAAKLWLALNNQVVRGTYQGQVATVNDVIATHRAAAADLAKLYGQDAGRILARFDQVNVRALAVLASRGSNAANFATLTKRHIAHAADDLDKLIDASVAQGISATRLAKDIEGLMTGAGAALGDYGVQGAPGLTSLASDARRIAVTEINNALRESNRQSLLASNIVAAAKWQLSGRHAGLPSSPDECDDLANADSQWGPGYYSPENWPLAPHPYCGCTQGGPPIFKPPAEWGTARPGQPKGPPPAPPEPPAPPPLPPRAPRKPRAPKAPAAATETLPHPWTPPTQTGYQPRSTFAAAARAAVDEVGIKRVTSEPGAGRGWGREYTVAQQQTKALQAMNEINDELTRLKQRFPGMLADDFTLVLRNSEARGLAFTGKSPARHNQLMPMSAGNVEQRRLSRRLYSERNNGRQWWTARPDYITRDTFRHELGHRLTLTGDVYARLEKALDDAGVPLGNRPGRPVSTARREWIKDNVSVYAATDADETVAEVFAMVTADNYVVGTLPKALEDFVEWMASAGNRPVNRY